MTILDAARVAPEKAVLRPALPMFLSPGWNGTNMKSMTYGEQLKHPNWQRKRLERLDAANWECENCGDAEKTLHVHHRQYFKGRMAWEYEGLELAVLCETCHQAEHSALDSLRRLLVSVQTGEALAIVAGFNFHADWIDPEEIESARAVDPLAFAAGFVAYMAYNLDIDGMLKVAAFAASLMKENTEARLVFTHSRGNTFGEVGPA